jgi:hypothetical protein
MPSLRPDQDWSAYVDEAVDDLLGDLLGGAGGREGLVRPVEPLDEPVAGVRERLVSYSMSMLAAAGAGTGALRCDNGDTTVDCEFVLRPHKTPFYRCIGHTPADCYDESYHSIDCP